MSTLISFVLIVVYLLTLIVDRFYLRRGKIDIVGADQYPTLFGSLRFAVEYWTKSKPDWSEITYRLVDRKDPTTVIQGHARPLRGKEKTFQHEFLVFDNKLITNGTWDLEIEVTTIGSKLNPLYSLFPLKSTYKKMVVINKKGRR